MQNREYDKACPRLAASYERAPSLAVLFKLAECEARWGKPASAIEHYQTFVDALTAIGIPRRPRLYERRDMALEMITALGAIAPRMVVEVPPDLPADVVITRNGQLVSPSSYGQNQQLDPGDYELRASQAGRTLWRRRVSLAQKDRVRVEIPAAAPWVLPASTAPRTDLAPLATGAGAAPDAARPWRIVAGSAAVAGLACGIAAGAVAWSEHSTIDQHCPEGVCDREGQRAADWARRTAVVSTVGFAVGLAGATAATMLFVRSKQSAARPSDRAHAPHLRLQPVLGVGRAPVIGVLGAFR